MSNIQILKGIEKLLVYYHINAITHFMTNERNFMCMSVSEILNSLVLLIEDLLVETNTLNGWRLNLLKELQDEVEKLKETEK